MIPCHPYRSGSVEWNVQYVKCEYEVQGQKIFHFLYMDDLKTYAINDNEQKRLLDTVKTFSDDIKMEFGLDKCAEATFNKGKLTETSSIKVDINTTIKELEQQESYKYLYINEGDGIQYSHMKEKIRKEYYRIVRVVLKVNSMQLIAFKQLGNTLPVPVVTNISNVISWQM